MANTTLGRWTRETSGAYACGDGRTRWIAMASSDGRWHVGPHDAAPKFSFDTFRECKDFVATQTGIDWRTGQRTAASCEGRTDGRRCGAPGNHTDWRKDVGTVSLCEIHNLSDVPKCCSWCGVYGEIRDDGYCSNGCRSNGTMAGLAR